MFDHRQVMADEDIAEIELAPQLEQQVQDLRLHRHVERRGRLVANHQFGLHHQGSGNRHALALAARQLSRPVVGMARGQPDAFEHVGRLPAALRRVAQAMNFQWQRDDVGDAAARIQRRIGVLKHRLDALGKFARPQFLQIDSAQQHATRSRLEQAQQQTRQRRFAAARLADDAQHIARIQHQIDRIDRLQFARRLQKTAADAEAAAQTFGLQDRLHAGNSARMQRQLWPEAATCIATGCAQAACA